MTQQILFVRRAVAAALIATLLSVTTFVLFEPALLRAQSDTDNVVVTLTVTGGITISTGADITMAPNISLTAATSTGSTSWTVVTNDPDGYTLDLRATGTPAMQSAGGANTIDDYTESASGTPDLWDAGANTAEFGFTAYGVDVADGTYGTQSACDSGDLDDGVSLYDGFQTWDQTVASRNATTSQSGETTTLCVAVEQTGTYSIPSDVYTAEIIATATVQ
jgi:hypothetical protein